MNHLLLEPEGAASQARAAGSRTTMPMTGAKAYASIMTQARYLETESAKYRQSGADQDSLATLYRLNGCARGYREELEALASRIPPMGEGCALSVMLCCRAEEGGIVRALEGWTTRQGGEGRGRCEIVVLVNRPRESEPWDATAAKAKEFAEGHPEFRIHVLEHTFNFPEAKCAVPLGGSPVEVDGGVRIGLVFKLAADLAVLRNMKRQDEAQKAIHLIATSGGDTYSRDRFFVERAVEAGCGGADFVKVDYRYPRAVAERHPLLWALHECRLSMAYEYLSAEFAHAQDMEREPVRRHGICRAGLYAEVGGFNPKLRLGEDMDFGRRVMLSGAPICRLGATAVDNPRRSLLAMLEGKTLIEEYASFGKSGRRMPDFDELAGAPGDIAGPGWEARMALNAENLDRHLNGHFRHYIRLYMENRFKGGGNLAPAFNEAVKLAANALTKAGVQAKDATFVYGDGVKDCSVHVGGGAVDSILAARDAWLAEATAIGLR